MKVLGTHIKTESKWIAYLPLVFIFILYIVIELFLHQKSFKPTDLPDIINQTLLESRNLFIREAAQQYSKTVELNDIIKELDFKNNQINPIRAFARSNNIAVMIRVNGDPYYWYNEPPTANYIQKTLPHSEIKQFITEIDKGNFLVTSTQFNVGNNNVQLELFYLLIDRNPIYQDESVYFKSNEWLGNYSYPVQFIYGNPIIADDDFQFKEVLVTANSDTLGLVTASLESESLYRFRISQLRELLSGIFKLLLVICLLISTLQITRNIDYHWKFIIRFTLVNLIWLFSTISSLSSDLIRIAEWIELPVSRSFWVIISHELISLLFFGLLTSLIISIIIKLKRYFGITWLPRTIVFSTVGGVLTGMTFKKFVMPYFIIQARHTLSVYDPNIIPSPDTFIFFLGLALTTGLTLLFSLFISYLLFNSEVDSISFVTPFFTTGLIITLSTITYEHLYAGFELVVGIFLIQMLFHLVGYYLHKKPQILQRISATRFLIYGSLALILAVYPLIIVIFYSQIDDDLKKSTDTLAIEFEQYSYFRTELMRPKSTIHGHKQGYFPGEVYLALYDYESDELRASWNSAYIPEIELSALSDSFSKNKNEIISRDIKMGNYYYRERITPIPDNNIVIRAVAEMPSPQNHIFSFTRYYYSIFVFFLFAGLLLLLFGKQIFAVQPKATFQSRILNSYLFATLIFLIVLVLSTQYLIRGEQMDTAKQDIKFNLNQIILSLKNDFGSNLTPQSLSYLSNKYDVNIDLYEGKIRIATAVKFQNNVHRFLELLPYGILNKLENGHNRLVFSQKEKDDFIYTRAYDNLALHNRDNYMVLAVTKRVNRSIISAGLVETISNLISVYVIIFGLFITLAFVISTWLARPLRKLYEGLQNISKGDLDSQIYISTQDEVGELANAYNFMLFRLKDLQNELAEAEREAAWSEMARQIAHEIKNPLTPMRLMLQHLQYKIEQETSPDEIKKAIDSTANTLLEQIHSLNAIATDFSTFAKPIKANLDYIDLNSIVESTSELYQHQRFIKLSLDLSDSDLTIKGVADELRRVLINLVKNSIEALQNGGLILIRTYAYKENAYLEITDNGQGIPIEKQSQIFQPNFSTKTTGTGLGLAICKKIIESHNGTISFASVPNSGTTFTISIPLVNFEEE